MLTPITKANCPKARAGIAKLWVTDCLAVATLTFNATHQITAITMDAGHADPIFHLFEFEKNTAFFNQAKTRTKAAVNVVQTIQFVEPGLSATVRKALYDLNLTNCCLHVIVLDNAGKFHYAGITYDAETSQWWSEDMVTGEGSSNTNTDPTADQAEYTETLVANTGFYAPFWNLTAADIPVD